MHTEDYISPWYRKPTKKDRDGKDFYFSIPRNKIEFGEIDPNTFYKIMVIPKEKKRLDT